MLLSLHRLMNILAVRYYQLSTILYTIGIMIVIGSCLLSHCTRCIGYSLGSLLNMADTHPINPSSTNLHILHILTMNIGYSMKNMTGRKYQIGRNHLYMSSMQSTVMDGRLGTHRDRSNMCQHRHHRGMYISNR